MKKAKLKIQKTKKSVQKFINSISSPKRKRDAEYVLDLMKRITGKEPAMWGESIVGFDEHTYIYESGREVDYYVVGFSARKDMTTIYIMAGYKEMNSLLEKIGPHKKGAACLYIKDMDKIDKATLSKVIEKGYKMVKK